MRFKIILPVLNQPSYTELCIRFLYETAEPFELIVVDNGSLQVTRESLAKLQKEFSFQIIRHELNIGWPKAVNEAIRALDGEYDFVVLLQNDCFVTSTFFARFRESYNIADPQAKIFLPKTNYSRAGLLQVEDEAVQRFLSLKHSNKGLPVNIDKIKSLLKATYGNFQKYGKQFDYFKKLTFCNTIDSYCMIIEKQVFDDGIYFDPEFKTLGWVEKEWAERAQGRGHEPWILNNVFVHHHGNLTSDGNGFNYPARYSRDEQLFGEKVDAS